ncbi:cytochrome c-type biogenesis protein [Deefgea sp. CFH1-16]|uniref:cytochrome c-type biogenesis protein n=1 Tax=Deefgea sp. CFH1-16 TaxID=2675457 RepID=UPI0015F57A0D|nr:cytochrome c-type biogenesis protein [Deefgea sp. CFH1-16]MBM5574092.1 cytochrome c-type biogenesis protein CcmH [Deefgea sp. CFH1-16]
MKRSFYWLMPILLALSLTVSAKTASSITSNPIAEARLVELSAELRCLVCQNESLASSQAPLAEDLRREVREQIALGKNNSEIISYLTDRYGDFVTYRPPFKARTLLLWLLPPVLLLMGLLLLWLRLRRITPPAAKTDADAIKALQQEFDGKNHDRD